MPTKPTSSARTTQRRRRAKTELRAFGIRQQDGPEMAELYHDAEVRLRQLENDPKSKAGIGKVEADSQQLLHELQVHHVELEMQNTELQDSRNRMEALLEKYTDLYDFAPAGYFTLAPAGVIRQVNLTGSQLMGIERSRLVGQSFGLLLSPEFRPDFNAFLKQVFAGGTKESIDVGLLRKDQSRPVIRVRAQRSAEGEDCRAVVVDITELKREEDKVRLSEIRYRRLFEAAHDGVLLLDPGTRKITAANPFMTELLGYPNDQLVGKELFEIGLLKDESASQEMFRKLKRQHEVRYEDLPLEGKTGRHQEVEVVANLYQENGHAVIQCNIRDITERKHTERELSEKARLLDLSHDAIIVRDVAGHIRYWNHGAEELYGWSRAEVLGKISHLLLQTKFPVPLEKMTAELRRTNRWIGELVHTKRDGRQITVLARKTLDRDRQGRPAAVLENITDITERKQAEQALRVSEERYRALFELGPVAIYSCDRSGVIQNFNRRAAELWGRSPAPGITDEKFCGSFKMFRSDGTFMPHKQGPMARVISGKTPLVCDAEVLIERPNGSRITVIVNIRPLKNERGEIEGAINCFYDITERKAAEAAQHRMAVLGSANQKLRREIIRRQAVEASLKKSERQQILLLDQSRFMQEQLRHLSRQVLRAQEEERKRISRELHDVIAQTLTSINIRLGTLKKEAGLDPTDFGRSITRTQKLVEKSVDIVHRFARELRPTVLDDLGLIPALHAFMKNFATETGVHTRLTAFAAVEQLDMAARTVLFRVAQEALTNVARHAKASRVEVSIQKLPAGIGMKIKDDGKAFDVERMLNGSGKNRLGLLGMRERLEMVGGKFNVKSAPGQGTTVEVQLPLRSLRGGGRRQSSTENKKLKSTCSL